MKTNLTIIGAGSWGTALAQVLADNDHAVTLYAKDEKVCDEINRHHTNRRYFEKATLIPTSIKATCDLGRALEGQSIILLSVPSQSVRIMVSQIVPYIKQKVTFINTAKGFDPSNNERLSLTIRALVPKKYLAAVVSLIGPSHAEEVIERQLTLVSAVCKKVGFAEQVSQLFSNEYFRVYVQRDEIGSEVGSALKNVIAIASGVVTGLKLGDNARAALVTRGLTELMRLGKVLGGKLKTHTGLTGLGDLIVTCYSQHSRNYQAGIKIGRDDSAEQFLANNKQTVEGVTFAKIAHELGKKHHLKLPIIEAVYAVLYEKKRPSELVKSLMNRPLKVE
ncbi:MAG: NAD(P)H-dependent glycerol-3-phosphate dehydrogenase [Bacilli bacterium]